MGLLQPGCSAEGQGLENTQGRRTPVTPHTPSWVPPDVRRPLSCLSIRPQPRPKPWGVLPCPLTRRITGLAKSWAQLPPLYTSSVHHLRPSDALGSPNPTAQHTRSTDHRALLLDGQPRLSPPEEFPVMPFLHQCE